MLLFENCTPEQDEIYAKVSGCKREKGAFCSASANPVAATITRPSTRCAYTSKHVLALVSGRFRPAPNREREISYAYDAIITQAKPSSLSR